MGYDVHIVRLTNWNDSKEESKITLDQWLEVVQEDKELELTRVEEIGAGEENLFQNKPGYCEWNGHPKYNQPNARPWFDFWNGRVSTQNPDEETIFKMMALAVTLKGRVQGDDGVFLEKDELIRNGHQTPSARTNNEAASSQPWWKFWNS